MPRVFIPSLLRELTSGLDELAVDGASVSQLIDNLEARFPGIRRRLCDGDDLKPGLNVAVSGKVSSLGVLQKVKPDSEVHFLPAIGGG